MDVVVSCERRFKRTPDGTCWTTSTGDYNSWQRYLSTFECVRVVAESRMSPRRNRDWREVAGPGVFVYGMPN